MAGVIGARKPQYDIWGNTVNVSLKETHLLICLTQYGSYILHSISFRLPHVWIQHAFPAKYSVHKRLSIACKDLIFNFGMKSTRFHHKFRNFKGFSFLNVSIYRCRGEIKVKGKGNMITYFLVDPPMGGQFNPCREYQGSDIDTNSNNHSTELTHFSINLS